MALQPAASSVCAATARVCVERGTNSAVAVAGNSPTACCTSGAVQRTVLQCGSLGKARRHLHDHGAHNRAGSDVDWGQISKLWESAGNTPQRVLVTSLAKQMCRVGDKNNVTTSRIQQSSFESVLCPPSYVHRRLADSMNIGTPISNSKAVAIREQ